MIGLGNQSNSFDDVALPAPTPGIFTNLVFSIKQNLGQGGVPIGPETDEFVNVYLVIVPYDNDTTYPNSYGIPKVTLTTLSAFLIAWQLENGTLTECTGEAEQGATGPLDGGGDPFIPIGTKVGLKTVLDEDNGHCAICTGGTISINACDTFTVWIVPVGFTSFQPSVSLIFATE
jgi:hypothetical protein